MKQIIQNFKTGKTILEETPAPNIRPGHVLIKTHRSLVSLGTEKMLVEFGQSSLLEKAKKNPDRVKQVLNKIKTDGLMTTLGAVSRKLDTPVPLGYSMAGEVIEVADNVNEFKIGDRVVSNGSHSEIISAPINLVAKIPDNVSYEQASFTVVSAIGLQGIRLADPKFGETVVVIGMGLIGLISAQLLISSGCNVIGVDIDPSKLALAEKYGVKTINSLTRDPVQSVLEETQDVGADSVIITASTKSNEIIYQAAEMSRKRGKIILVGVIGLEIDRATFYKKELSFQVSCSYGPGRHDEEYELMGNDYPLAYVRWTEKRNFEAVLNALSNNKLLIENLITERIPLEEYLQIYGDISKSQSIASLIEYPTSSATADNKREAKTIKVSDVNTPSNGQIAIIGTGNFTQGCILPSLNKGKNPVNQTVKYLVSGEGLSSTTLAKKFKIPFSSTDYNEILSDTDVNAVIITTRHNLHAPMAIEALKNGKHVFIEKPIALTSEEFESIKKVKLSSGKSICVGFNRRFSPHTEKIKSLLGEKPAPMNVIATMNAGFIPDDHWTQLPNVGGGRIIGEACHYFDLLIHLTGSCITSVCMTALGKNPSPMTDTASILIKFENGSSGVINYLSNGSKAYSKEKIEIFSEGRNLVLDNFRNLHAYGFKKNFLKKGNGVILKTAQDKGHANQFKKFVSFLKEGGEPLIPFDEIENSTKASFAAIESLKRNSWVDV